MRYPAKLKLQDVGNYAVSFPDIPEALTLSDTEQEALRHALDALETAFDFYFEHNRSIPLPSLPKRGQRLVELSPNVSAKILLYNELCHSKCDLRSWQSALPSHASR